MRKQVFHNSNPLKEGEMRKLLMAVAVVLFSSVAYADEACVAAYGFFAQGVSCVAPETGRFVKNETEVTLPDVPAVTHGWSSHGTLYEPVDRPTFGLLCLVRYDMRTALLGQRDDPEHAFAYINAEGCATIDLALDWSSDVGVARETFTRYSRLSVDGTAEPITDTIEYNVVTISCGERVVELYVDDAVFTSSPEQRPNLAVVDLTDAAVGVICEPFVTTPDDASQTALLD